MIEPSHSMQAWHPLVKRLLDGELRLEDLPVELRPEGEEALQVLAALDRSPVTLSAQLESRVMEAVRCRATPAPRRIWDWLLRPREIHLRLRPWVPLAGIGAATLAVLFGRPTSQAPDSNGRAGVPVESVYVRFVLYAPDAQRVALAGTFNEWNPAGTPLMAGADQGVWVTTLALPVGQHQYVFVVDGGRWMADPAAPRVEDGFGRTNSVLAVLPGGRTL